MWSIFPSLGGGIYFITFIDDFSHYGRVFILKNKSGALAAFQMYKNESETGTGYSLKTLRSDRGGEYLNTLFDEELRRNGIIRQLTNPWTPEQNGVAECLNRTLIEMVLALLTESGLPKSFWVEALCTAMYIRNCVLTCSVAGKTPFEAWFGVKPSVEHFRVWGSCCYVLRDH